MLEKKYVVYIDYYANDLREVLKRFRIKKNAEKYRDRRNTELNDYGYVGIMIKEK